jgi:CheY-like chemotaxis protein
MHARDGEEALDYLLCRGKFADRDPELPLVMMLDLKMPKISGLEVLRQIRAIPHLARLPVVIMTSSREQKDLQESYRLGINSYVVKPIQFAEFVEAVRHIGAYWTLVNEPPPGCVAKSSRSDHARSLAT